MTEFHVYTEHGDKFEQAYVFVVDREDNGKINMKTMYTVTVMSDKGEVKTKMNVNNIFNEIIRNVGGNIDTNRIELIFNVFGDLIPDDVKEQIRQQHEHESEADLLLRSSEIALSAHPINQSIDEIISGMKK